MAYAGMNAAKSARRAARALGGLCLAVSAGLLAGPTTQVLARSAPITADSIVDRMQIEALITDYYSELGTANPDIAQFYTEDGVLETNGSTFAGKAAMRHLFASESDTRVQPENTYNLVLSNPQITVTGDTATAHVIWTGYVNDNPYTAPRLLEQGTDDCIFVKQDGVWLFKLRKVTNQGGRPPWKIGEKGKD